MYDATMRFLDELFGLPARPPSGYKAVTPITTEMQKAPNKLRNVEPNIVIDPVGDALSPTHVPTYDKSLYEYMISRPVKG